MTPWRYLLRWQQARALAAFRQQGGHVDEAYVCNSWSEFRLRSVKYGNATRRVRS